MKIYVDKLPKNCAECEHCTKAHEGKFGLPFCNIARMPIYNGEDAKGRGQHSGSLSDFDCPLHNLQEQNVELLAKCGVLHYDPPGKKGEPAYKEVTIPACEGHCGLYSVKVKLRWICPVCGKPRGEIKPVRSYDGSQVLFCDGWTNHCGHIDKYDAVRKEAKENGLNEVGNE